jgi:hypothetical protein
MRTDGRTGGHDEANMRFSTIHANTPKTVQLMLPVFVWV